MKRSKGRTTIRTERNILADIDNSFLSAFDLTDTEFDILCWEALDSELALLLKVIEGNASFEMRRKAIQIIQRYRKSR